MSALDVLWHDIDLSMYEVNFVASIHEEILQLRAAAADAVTLRERVTALEAELTIAIDILRALDGYGTALPDEAHELIAAHPAAPDQEAHNKKLDAEVDREINAILADEALHGDNDAPWPWPEWDKLRGKA